MRIGLDISSALAGLSGIRLYIEELLCALAAVNREDEFILYGAFWSGLERLDGLKLPQTANFHRAFKRFPQRLLLPAEELGLGLQNRWFRDLRVDVFHGLGHLAPPLKGIPAVVTVHHVGGISDRATAWDRFYLGTLTRRSARRAAAVIAVSEFTRQEALRAWGLDPQRVIAVHEGGPSANFRPPQPGERPPRPYPYILHVGSFQEHKNIPALVQAYRLWLDRFPDRSERLILVGRPGRDSTRVAELLERLKIAERAETLPAASREEIIALYQHASVTVVPSLLEGFGFPVLEAMACGAPSIVSTAATLPEIAGDAALLFDPVDTEALSRALESVLKDPTLAADLRRRGLARARAFSWEETARKTLEVYRAVLQRA